MTSRSSIARLRLRPFRGNSGRCEVAAYRVPAVTDPGARSAPRRVNYSAQGVLFIGVAETSRRIAGGFTGTPPKYSAQLHSVQLIAGAEGKEARVQCAQNSLARVQVMSPWEACLCVVIPVSGRDRCWVRRRRSLSVLRNSPRSSPFSYESSEAVMEKDVHFSVSASWC